VYKLVKVKEKVYGEFLKEIKDVEAKKWKPQKQGFAIGIIEAFLDSDMKMAEVDLDKLPAPESKYGSREKSNKQDSFASSFYAWKKKKSTKEKLAQMCIDVIIIRRGNKVALKKKAGVSKK
jgi:hypothetical protein